jgi:hypothetical protein
MKTLGLALAAMSLSAGPVCADAAGPPEIGTLTWDNARTVCVAWPEGQSLEQARSSGVSWVGLPASVKPFGMRGYVNIDGRDHPLKQIAYANPDGTLSIYYRSLGERHYDVYLNLSGLVPGTLTGTDLGGTLVVSRFGLLSETRISGSCGVELQ